MIPTFEIVEKLKRALREDTMPLLSQQDLEDLILESNTIDEAIYRGAIIKSENTSVQLSGMSITDTSKYFLRLASLHRPVHSGILK